jgi:nitronate monooxygenase
MDFGRGPEPVPRYFVVPPNRSATGRVDAMALYAGESVAAVRDVKPAAEIVRELAEGAERILRNRIDRILPPINGSKID